MVDTGFLLSLIKDETSFWLKPVAAYSFIAHFSNCELDNYCARSMNGMEMKLSSTRPMKLSIIEAGLMIIKVPCEYLRIKQRVRVCDVVWQAN